MLCLFVSLDLSLAEEIGSGTYGYKDSDNRASWYYQNFYNSFEENSKPLKIACREISLPWSDRELVEHGCNIRVADGYRGSNGWVTSDNMCFTVTLSLHTNQPAAGFVKSENVIDNRLE